MFHIVQVNPSESLGGCVLSGLVQNNCNQAIKLIGLTVSQIGEGRIWMSWTSWVRRADEAGGLKICSSSASRHSGDMKQSFINTDH